ncbi:hypothetical protein ACHAXT_008575 [Thalassiosira profunda]
MAAPSNADNYQQACKLLRDWQQPHDAGKMMTVLTVPLVSSKAERVVAIENLDAETLQSIRKSDPFLYHSIDRRASQDHSPTRTTTSKADTTVVRRSSRISFEKHPDSFFEDLYDDFPPGDDGGDIFDMLLEGYAGKGLNAQ